MEELKIGIVAEGISDYWVLKHLVEHFLKEHDPLIVSLQPKVTKAGKQEGFGGWKNVFEYISKKEYLIDLAQTEGCNYIIVQLDTDVSEQYSIAKDDDLAMLIDNVRNKINETMHVDFDRQRVIYAVCIHSLECWLIPFVSTDKTQCSRVDNCVNTINKGIRTLGTIDKDNKGSAKRLYEHILQQKKKPKAIEECAQYNLGFERFIEELKGVRNNL